MKILVTSFLFITINVVFNFFTNYRLFNRKDYKYFFKTYVL